MFLLDSILSVYSIRFSNNIAVYKNDTIYFNFQDSTFKYKARTFRFSFQMRQNKVYVDGNDVALIIYRLTTIPIFYDVNSKGLFKAIETIKRFQILEHKDSCILTFELSRSLEEQVWLDNSALLVHIKDGFYPKFNLVKGDGILIDSTRIFHTKEGAFFKIFISNKYGSHRKFKDSNVLKFIIYSYENFGYIVIDPGHGGEDPGAIGKWGIKEKDITLSVGKRIVDILRREYGFKVILTREDDRFVSLKERAEISKRYNAKLFVSIHCNYSEIDNVSGPETYFLSVARTNEERAVETLENSVIKY